LAALCEPLQEPTPPVMEAVGSRQLLPLELESVVNSADTKPRDAGTPSSTRRLASVLIRGVEILSVAGLIAGYLTLAKREDEFGDQQREFETHAHAVSARLDEVRETAGQEIESLKTSLVVVGDSARAREERLRQDLDHATATLKLQERRLSQISGLQEERLAKSESEIGHKIELLAAQLALDKTSRREATDRFRTIQEKADESVFLIHCVFTYETKEYDDDWKEHQATTWGTAFAVSDDGFLITNKHLVMPWKFDSELAALRAMGEVRIREDSVKLAAWPVGTTCLDTGKKANFRSGFSSERGTLSIVSTAADNMTEKSVEMAGKTVKYNMHALDNQDLALLRVTEPTKGLPFADASDAASIKKLDPVMAIGFPRGVGGLESTLAVPSATVGSVRKVEDTIHISAPIVAGNSGGPVFDEQGHVIGVATRIYCETLGICIKADHARKLLDAARPGPNVAIAASVPGN
jgi:S1-C subfamily serine protease